jgi:hypothetical protein
MEKVQKPSNSEVNYSCYLFIYLFMELLDEERNSDTKIIHIIQYNTTELVMKESADTGYNSYGSNISNSYA